jgi:anti-sigma-K factor RskA
MDYSRNELADRLAAEYVAGTLRGGARRRFESLLPAHAGLRRATREWEARLMPLTQVVAPEVPPGVVWERIHSRIEGLKARPKSRARPAPRLWLWQGLTAFASVAALAFGVLLARSAAEPPATDTAMLPPTVVVLSTTGEPAGGAGPSSFVATISSDGRFLVTKPLVSVRTPSDRALELWAVPDGGSPRSLGLISPTETTVLQKLKPLKGAAALAVSLEPKGGSTTGAPTGPVLWTGKLTS